MGIVQISPILPETARSISAARNSKLMISVKPFEKIINRSSTGIEVLSDAKIRVLDIEPMMSRPIFIPDLTSRLPEMQGSIEIISHIEEETDIATSITAPIAPIIIPANKSP